MNRKAKWLLLGALLVAMGAGALSLALAQSSANVLTAVKVDKAPTIDGTVDDIWSQATAVQIAVSGGANMGSTTVVLKAVYTSQNVYFLAQWADPTESLQRAPWQKQADGSWKKLKDPNDKGGDSNLYYEDKFAMIWNINESPIAGFEQQGCMITCHTGEGKPFGNKYTANPGEVGDIWHWKSVRTGSVNQIDDQYVDSTRYDPQTAPEAGRKSDPKFLGGYYDNKNADGTAPAFTSSDQPAPPYWIYDNVKQAFADTYSPGDEVAGIIVAPLLGDRGDMAAKAIYADGLWTLEWGRKLNTSSPLDVQFTDLSKNYLFGVAVFDNAQVRHAFHVGAYILRFAQ